MLKVLRWSGILVVLAFISLCSIPVLWLLDEWRTPYYAEAQETFVELPKGATPRTIAGLLCDAGVLRSRIPFLLYLRWTAAGQHLQAGEYRFSSAATPRQVIERLVLGDVFFRAVTVPEGLTAQETIELVARTGLGNEEELERELRRVDWIRDLDPTARSLEGYLFPETYRFPRKANSSQIVKAMVDQFRERLKKLLAEHPLPHGWSLGEVVTLASLIEKEVKNHEERTLVASVLTNRLQKGIPLACDPTVIYALKLTGKYDGNIRKVDLSMESPYNTYVNPGLPPSPIANPGADALLAALAPAKTEFLYFVSRNDGTHQFSKDYRSHQIAVNRYQKYPGR